MRIGSLFAGIGGFDLAARWMGWTTAWVSEIEPYASAVLRRHFPEAPNLGDITLIDGTKAPPIDMLVGGFPCQDISFAGKGAGIEGARSGLWSHYARLIKETAPRWVVIENVSALRSRGLDRVLKDLAALGYDAEWYCIPASYVGALHQRDRIWIVAYPHTDDGWNEGGTESSGWTPRLELGRSSQRLPFRTADSSVADPVRLGGPTGLSGPKSWEEGDPDFFDYGRLSGGVRWSAPFRWWLAEPAVGRVAHGISRRVDRLRGLGNAIVPQVAFLIFSEIHRYEILHAGGS